MNQVVLKWPKRLFIVFALVTFLLCVGFCWLLLKPTPVAYIDISKVVNAYQMKKDLEQQTAGDLNRIKAVTDSLKMLKKMANNQPSPALDTQIMYAQYAFKQYYEQSNRAINEKIWERLNPLLETYGKERGLQLLVGANGAGTVLYGDKSIDLTEDLIKYLNNKYEKGN